MIRALLAASLVLLWSGMALASPLPVKTAHIKKDTKHDQVDMSYPRTGVEAIDRDLAAAIAKLRKDYAYVPSSFYHGANSLDVSYTVLRNDSKMFVVRFDIESFGGGAHPNHDVETFNYLMPEGWRVYLPEIVGHNGIAVISRLAIADLTRQNEESQFSDADWIARGASPDADNFRAFAWLPDKLELYFPDYQVAAYVAGEQQAAIPLAALRSVVRADWHAPVASFDCGSAKADIEMAICGDAMLARLDRQMSTAYNRKWNSAEGIAAKAKLRAEQRAWLTRRDTDWHSGVAGHTACLTALYGKRLGVLTTYP